MVKDYQRGQEFPIDALVSLGFPKNVAGAKLHKLQKRGWISLQYKLLPKGIEALCDAMNAKADEGRKDVAQ